MNRRSALVDTRRDEEHEAVRGPPRVLGRRPTSPGGAAGGPPRSSGAAEGGGKNGEAKEGRGEVRKGGGVRDEEGARSGMDE